MPQEGELLGRVTKIEGGDHVVVKCVDGKVRLGRIRGKMKRRVWIRENDAVLVAPLGLRRRQGRRPLALHKGTRGVARPEQLSPPEFLT